MDSYDLAIKALKRGDFRAARDYYICAPHHANVCKISRLCGGAISSIVFNRSLSNLAILLIFIEKTVKGSVDCNFRIATGRKIA